LTTKTDSVLFISDTKLTAISGFVIDYLSLAREKSKCQTSMASGSQSEK
jgi:hypothetical protein